MKKKNLMKSIVAVSAAVILTAGGVAATGSWIKVSDGCGKCKITEYEYISEVMSLSVFADLYRQSPMADIRQYHPKARRMVSHNKRWVYIFHVEGEIVIVDRIRPAKTIAK